MMDRIPEKIELTAQGEWLSDGEPITHQRTLEFFYRSIRRHENSYALVAGWEVVPITVADTAYFVKSVVVRTTAEVGRSLIQSVELGLSDQTFEILDYNTLELSGDRLTCRLQRHGELETVRFLPAAYHSLLFHAVETDSGYEIQFPHKNIILCSK